MSRHINIKRLNKTEDYGFLFRTLKSDGKHICYNVFPDKPAYNAGLREDDYILEVNDESVSGLCHDAVRLKLTRFSKTIKLLVVSDIKDYIRSSRKSSQVYSNYNSSKNYEEDTYNFDSVSVVKKKTSLASDSEINKAKMNSYFRDYNGLERRRSSGQASRLIDHSDLRPNISRRKTDASTNLLTRNIPSEKNQRKLMAHHNQSDYDDIVSYDGTVKSYKSTQKNYNLIFNDGRKSVFEITHQQRSKPPRSFVSAEKPKNEYEKKIRLQKRHPTESYGFSFRILKNYNQHSIASVVPDSIAHEAGMREKDFLFEVNGDIISSLPHNQVLKKINSRANDVELLIVTDIDSYIAVKQIESNWCYQRATDQDTIRFYMKKICDIQDGLEIVSNGIINRVVPDSPADRAYLKKGLKIIRINGVDLRAKNYKDIIKLLLQEQNILIIDALKMYNVPTSSNERHSALPYFENDEQVYQRQSSENKVTDYLNNHIELNQQNSKNEPVVVKPRSYHEEKVIDSKATSYPIEKSFDEPLESKDSDSTTTELSDEEENKADNEKVIGSRIVTIFPNENFGGYGCELMSDEVNNVVEIGSLLPNYPAFIAGLKQGDVLLRVNNKNMNNKTFTQVYNIFSRDTVKDPVNGTEMLKLEVIQKSLYFRDLHEVRDKRVFKRCTIELAPGTSSFGLTLIKKDVKPKHSIVDVDQNSAAYRANVRKYDVIVEVNGKNIRKFSYFKLKNIFESCAMSRRMELLVIEREGYYFYKQKNKNFSNKELVTEKNTERFSSMAKQSKMV